jgi:glutamyl-tRNA(Gln) amidotransferase subunit D
VIDFYVKKGYKGIIIEGTGLGNLPGGRTHEQFSWLDKLDSAVKKGVVVGLTSQCMYGRVSKNVYSKMREISALGVIYCEDMTAEAAYVKLGWLLGNYKPEEAKALLDKSIAREIKERSNYDEFLI